MNFRELVEFINLSQKRTKGFVDGEYENYLKFQEFQANLTISELKERGIDLSKYRALELAADIGGYSLVLKKHCKELIINDLREPYILKIDPSIKFKKFDASKRYPIEDNIFDLVFCSSLIEHVSKPEKMLQEIYRILKPQGILYLSFPPFYSPVGGHSFKPFHLLGERIAIKIINKIKKRNIKDYAHFYERNYAVFGLYRRTIKGVKKLLIENNFSIIDIWTRFSPINTAKIPLVNEFITWHVCFLCRAKKYSESPK